MSAGIQKRKHTVQPPDMAGSMQPWSRFNEVACLQAAAINYYACCFEWSKYLNQGDRCTALHAAQIAACYSQLH